MRGFRWGYWNQPGGHWLYPPNRGRIFYLPYQPYPQGTCAAFGALDLTLLEDEDIRENVIASLFADARIPRKDKEQIEVTSQNNIVSLKGTVQSRQSKAWAYFDALSTPGVKEVKNQILIQAV